MDWNDGKSFGEFHWKKSGAFSESNYPISQTGVIKRIRGFLHGVSPDTLKIVGSSRARKGVFFETTDGVTALGLCNDAGVWGWAYAPTGAGKRTIVVRGLEPGAYSLTLVNPWKGAIVWRRNMTIERTLTANFAKALGRRVTKREFPADSRHWTGRDVAFKITKRVD